MLELTGTEIATTLLMERQVDQRLCLVVEGDEECALIDIHLNHRDLKTLQSGSKSAVIAAAEELSDAQADWVLCVVDADFSALRPELRVGWPANVVTSDNYDLLMDIVNLIPYKIEGIAISHSSPGTIIKRVQETGVSVFEEVVSNIRVVGLLRYLVVSNQISVSVRNWDFSGIISLESDAQRVNHAARVAAARSKARYTPEYIASVLSAELHTVTNFHLLLNGHDFVSVLHEIVDKLGKSQPGRKAIAASIRVSLSCAEFQRLTLVKLIIAWSGARKVIAFNCELR